MCLNLTPLGIAVLDRRGPAWPRALLALSERAPGEWSSRPGLVGARVRRLLDSGYRLQTVQPVDMFPRRTTSRVLPDNQGLRRVSHGICLQ